MINLSDLGQVYIVCGKTDLRKGIDGLACLIKEQFQLDPFQGQVFLFCGSRKDRFNTLCYLMLTTEVYLKSGLALICSIC